MRLGLLAMLAGIVVLLGALDADASARIVTVPLLLAGLGIGALASQLGAVTVSDVPDELSPEVGGLQNTATTLGAAIGTALAGSILVAALTTSFLQGVAANPAIPEQVKSQASVRLAGGVAALDVNEAARLAGLRAALAVLAIVALAGLLSARRIPGANQTTPPGDRPRPPATAGRDLTSGG